MMLIEFFFIISIFIVPAVFAYSIFLAVKNINTTFDESIENTSNNYLKILFISSTVIDFANIIIWILCVYKAIQPYHDPAIGNFIEYCIFAAASIVLRAIAFKIFSGKPLEVRYSIDLIISFIAILKLFQYGYNALVKL